MTHQDDAASNRHDLVVVGSSAGGIEALSIFVSTLPADFPAPIVLAQHLDPNRPSALDIILQRRSTLPVVSVTKSAVLENGKIYVIPSNHHVSIKDHHVDVLEDPGRRPRPSVDGLLSTASQWYGEHLIAVIMTGSGSDGASGAIEVKKAGGTVIVQDPQTARYPSMPMALPPTIIDFEERVERIGPLLYNLLTGVTITQTEEKTEDMLQVILELVSNHANIDFRPYKTSTILRRIGRRVAVTQTRTIADYAEYLKQRPDEIGELVKSFLINVTQFFRDEEAFAYLRSDILPKLIARASEADHVLRFWAAGCATGEEPYSLAMLLSDMLGADLPKWSIKIFATDLDEATISFARRGLYSENLLKGMAYEYRDRFFERADQGYRISKTLRQMVIFGQQDLSHSAPFPRIDMVLCRNVLIYFTPELQDYVLSQFAFSLNSNGYLFLGKAETVRPTQQQFELVNKHWKVYRCTGSSLPVLRQQTASNLKSLPGEGRAMTKQPGRSPSKANNEQDSVQMALELGQLRRFNELLLRFLPIGVVVVDSSYHIMTANSAARRLLGLHDVSPNQDFLHTVHGIPYPSTRDAIDSVFREHGIASLPEVELSVGTGGSGRFLSISISLMQLETNGQEYATISVTDVTDQVQTRQQIETAQASQAQLMNELGATNKRLSDMNKELMDANEELQVANEELMLTHEELQASIEELETTNEELQATNEELETNNEELQATNEELETTNEELRARTNELQEMTNILDTERARLAEMIELSPFYILILRGSNLVVEAYNPRHMRRLQGRAVQGYPLEDVPELFANPRVGGIIARLAHEAYQFDEVRTTSRMFVNEALNSSEERYLVYTIVPSHDARGNVDGVLIYALDEMEQRAHETAEELERLKIVFERTPLALLALYDATTAELVMASPGYIALLEHLGREIDSSVKKHTWHEVTLVTPPEQARVLWQTVLNDQTLVRIPELHFTFPDTGQETVWDYSLTPINDMLREERIRFVLVSTLNITEQVQARIELERLDTLKDTFLSMATHELRSPLTAIQGNVQYIQRLLKRRNTTSESDGASVATQKDEQWLTPLERVVQQTTRMNQLIDEMMDAARVGGKMFRLRPQKDTNVIDLVRGVIDVQPEAVRANHELRLHVDLDEAIGTIDPHRVEQVLQNLLSNAIKYSPADKPVDITIAADPATLDTVLLSVKDEGEGIPLEEQAHIFDRFYRISTQNADGLGLGLYIANEITTQQGGHLWVESTPGKGSTFFFSLPLHHEES